MRFFVRQKAYRRVQSRVHDTFWLHDAWRGGNVESINDLAQRAKDAEQQLRAILDGDEWTYPIQNEAVRASIKRVLRDNAKRTGNY